MVSYVALPYQIYQLTGSNFAVGAMGLVELVPLVVFGLYGGALADHVDRRTMLVLTGGRPGRAHRRAARQLAAARPAGLGHLRHRRPAVGRPVAAAAEPRGAASRAPCGTTSCRRRWRVSSLGMQIGTLLGPARRRPARRHRRRAVGVRRRRRRARDRHRAVPGDARLPADRPEHAAEPRRDRRGHPVRGRPQRPARHLRHRHDRDVPGDTRSCCSRRSRRTCSTSRRRSACSTPPRASAPWSRP